MNCSLFLLSGTLSTLAHFFKVGRRNVTLPLTPHLWAHISALMASSTVTSNTIARKTCMKLAQRAALTLLDPTAISITAATTRAARSLSASPPAEAIEDEVLALTKEGTKIIPEVVDTLLGGLRDTDTVVRWSAAKGLGRVAVRLPAVCAGDITDALLELFSPAEMDTGWQGACLALAELVRHGLVPPTRLPQVCVACSLTLAYHSCLWSLPTLVLLNLFVFIWFCCENSNGFALESAPHALQYIDAWHSIIDNNGIHVRAIASLSCC
jgi:tubulin-specific chaperone D